MFAVARNLKKKTAYTAGNCANGCAWAIAGAELTIEAAISIPASALRAHIEPRTSAIVPQWGFFSSRRRHPTLQGDWSSDVCSSDLHAHQVEPHASHPSGHRRVGGRRAQTPA